MRIRKTNGNAVTYELSASDFTGIGAEIGLVMMECSLGHVGPLTHAVASFLLPAFISNIEIDNEMEGVPIELHLHPKQQSLEFEFTVAGIDRNIVTYPDGYDDELSIEEFMDEVSCESDNEEYMNEEYDECDEYNEYDEYDEYGDAIDNINAKPILVNMLSFKTLEDVINYTKACSGIKKYPNTVLYKKDGYHLICSYANMSDTEINVYEPIASEWMAEVSFNPLSIAYMKEHGTVMIKKKVYEMLQNL